MDETKAFALINRAVHAAMGINVILAVTSTILIQTWLASVIYAGLIVAQAGLCCAAYHRNDNLREEAILLFVAVISSGFLTALAHAKVDVGYVLLAIGLITMVGLVIHLVPLILLKFLFRSGMPRFSILQIMMFTAVIGSLAALAAAVVAWADEASWLIGAAILLSGLLFFPSALACWLLNFTRRSLLFLPIMLLVSGVIMGLASLLSDLEDEGPIVIFLASQTFFATIGGVILLQVRPSPMILAPDETASEGTS